MELKIRMEHKENPWVIEVVGIGDPHNPADLYITMNDDRLERIVEELKSIRDSLYGAAFLPSDIMQSRDDMYLWRLVVGRFTAQNPGWKVRDNLPELRIEEDEEVRKLREQEIIPVF